MEVIMPKKLIGPILKSWIPEADHKELEDIAKKRETTKGGVAREMIQYCLDKGVTRYVRKEKSPNEDCKKKS